MLHFNRSLVSVLLLAVLFLLSSVASAQNLLTNPGFEEPLDEEGLPPGWVIFAGEPGVNIRFAPKSNWGGGEGTVFVLDPAGISNTGLRSEPLPAKAGEVYRATGWLYTPPGSRSALYLDFQDENGQRVHAEWALVSTNGVWQEVTVTLEAPEGTATVSVILYSNITSAPSPVAWDDIVLEKISG